MMGIAAITGKDTLTLYDRVFTDLADDDVSAFTFPDDLVELKTGKNANTLYAVNEAGNNAELVLRVVRGSADDKFLNSKFADQKRDFASSTLAKGDFVKRLGDGQGTTTRDVYNLVGGAITKNVEAKDNASGDTEQSVSIYNMKFASVTRSLA